MSQRILLYTLALDLPDTLDYRLMAKMLAGSVLRNYFSGTVRIFRNREQPIFRLLRDGLQELHVETPEMDGLGHKGSISREGLASVREQAGLWKARAAGYLEKTWDVVMYVDADTVSLRGLESLLEGENWDILYLPDGPEQVSAAVWAVRGPHYHAVMGEWMDRMQREEDWCWGRGWMGGHGQGSLRLPVGCLAMAGAEVPRA